ncbi:MAG: citramalate synthase, partial [Thermomicrobium sp.]|nr:citramalate synthase [Thermomicrobium sp.]
LAMETFKNSEIAVFTMTRRKSGSASKDENLNSVIDSGFNLAVLVGKGWSLHVKEVLKTSLEENLSIIVDSIEYLRSHGVEVIFDAEHFFDGYKDNPQYAIQVLKTAEEAHARTLVLADTNGGCLPHEVAEIVSK